MTVQRSMRLCASPGGHEGTQSPTASGRQRGSIRRAEGDGVVYRSPPKRKRSCCDGSQQALRFQAFLANNVKTPSAIWIATTCDELRPLALSADAASGDESISSRSDCISFLLVRLTRSSIFERASGFRSLTSTTCMLCMTVLD